MKIKNQTILHITILLVLCFSPLGSNVFPNYIPVAFSQQQDSSFHTEVSAIDNIHTQKVKSG
jgi:hypothetical protein